MVAFLFAEHEKDKRANEQYYSRDYWVNQYKNHLEYQEIVDFMNEKAPKSFSGYMRMKKQNTKNFLKIKEIAEQNNITINLIKP